MTGSGSLGSVISLDPVGSVVSLGQAVGSVTGLVLISVGPTATFIAGLRLGLDNDRHPETKQKV